MPDDQAQQILELVKEFNRQFNDFAVKFTMAIGDTTKKVELLEKTVEFHYQEAVIELRELNDFRAQFRSNYEPYLKEACAKKEEGKKEMKGYKIAVITGVLTTIANLVIIFLLKKIGVF